MKKKINLIIKNCKECPYLEYDPYYDCNRDSGYNCNLVNKRIINDSDLDYIPTSITIPEWCPLEDVEGDND